MLRLLDRPCPECQEHHGPNVRECPYMPSSYYAEDGEEDHHRDPDQDYLEDTEPY